MKKLLVFCLVAALSAGLLVGCGSKESTNESETEVADEQSLETDSNGKTYTHDFDSDTNQVIDFYEIEFQIPEDWTEVGDSDGTVYNSPDGTLSISSNEKTGSDLDLTSQEEQDKIIASVDSGDSFVETGHKTMTILGDVTALYFTCSQNISDTPVDMYVIAFYTEDRNYMFGYADRQSADYNHSKDFDQVINSITWAPGYGDADDAEEAEEAVEEEPAVEKTVTHDFNEETNKKNEQFYSVGFDVPQTWEQQEVTTTGVRTYLMGEDSLTLTYEKVSYGDSYAQYEDDILSSLKTDYNDFKLIDKSERDIYDGKTALDITFTWKDGDESYEDRALFFKQFNGLIGFIFQSAKSSEYDRTEDYESVINSLREWSREDSDSEEAEPEVTSGEREALQAAKHYLDTMPFAYSELIEQLEFSGYSEEEATYAVDNCGADWNEQAALKAQNYLDTMSFSKEELINQLEYEGFTADQAAYGASSVLG